MEVVYKKTLKENIKLKLMKTSIKQERGDSNPQPLVLETRTLPIELLSFTLL